jgi:hypothetical protein
MPEKMSVSPYLEAWRWIEMHAGTDSARDLAKLLLSLAQGADFSVRECVDKLDSPRTELALRVIGQYARGGTEEEKERLLVLGHRIGEAFPRLLELAQAAREAKRAVNQAEASREEHRCLTSILVTHRPPRLAQWIIQRRQCVSARNRAGAHGGADGVVAYRAVPKSMESMHGVP